MNRLAVIAIVSTLLALLAIILAWFGWSRQATVPLRLALDPWPSEELLWLAKQRGFFAGEGLDLQLVELATTGDTRVAFERGQVDLAPCTGAELARMAGSREPPPRAVLVLDWSAGADVVMARAAIPDLAGLRGRRVAYEPGGVSAHVLGCALATAGLAWGDITPVAMAVPGMNEALSRDEVDAVVTYPPFNAELAPAVAHRLFDSRRIPGEIVDLVVADGALLQRMPDLPERLQRAWDRALALVPGDQTAMAAMAARESLSVEAFRASLDDGIRLVPGHEQAAFLALDGPLAKLLPRIAETMRRTGEHVPPFDPAACLLPRPADRDRP